MKKLRRTPSDIADPSARMAEIRGKIGSGRTMSALKEAKELARQRPDAATAALLADAYSARIDDLSQAGMTGDARALLQVAAERLPEHKARWDERGRAVARRTGDLSDVLLAWRDAASDAERKRAGQELAGCLRDPATITQSEILPLDDPLRAAAEVVSDSLVAATLGQLGDRQRDALRRLPRHSPLASWRCLALAIDAFHRHDDDTASALLSRIPDDQPVARGKSVLQHILSGAPLATASPAANRLVDRLSGGVAPARRTAQELRACTASGAARSALLRQLLVRVAACSTRLAMRLARWLLEQSDDASDRVAGELFDGLGGKLFGHGEFARLWATTANHDDPAVSLADWLEWLVQPSGTVRTMPDQELAVAIDCVWPMAATLWPVLQARMPEQAELISSGPDALMMSFGGSLRDPSGMHWIDPAQTMLAWSAFLVGIRARRRMAPVTDHPVDALALEAHSLAPDADRCADYLASIPPRDTDRRNLWLDAWGAALPQDAEPWVQRAIDAERRNAFKLALSHLDRAEALAPLDTRVRVARFRLLLAQLVRHYKKGALQQCSKDLDGMAALPIASTPAKRQFLLSARAMVDTDDAAVAALQAEVGPERAALATAFAAAKLSAAGRTVQATSGTRARQLADTAWLAMLADEIGESRHLVRLPATLQGVDLAELPSEADALLALAQLGDAAGETMFVLQATQRGIEVQGASTGWHLLLRSRALGYRHGDRAYRCRRLARTEAERSGDRTLLAVLRNVEPLAAEVATDWLADERKRVIKPGSTPTAGKPKPRPPKRRPSRPAHPQLPFPETRAEAGEA